MRTSVERLRPLEILWVLDRESDANMNLETAVQTVCIYMLERNIISIEDISNIRQITDMKSEDLSDLEYKSSSDIPTDLRPYESQIVENAPNRLIEISPVIKQFDFEDFFVSENIYERTNVEDSIKIFGKTLYGSPTYNLEVIERNWKELQRQIMNKDERLRKKYRRYGEIDEKDVAYVPVFRTMSRWAIDFVRYWDVKKSVE